MKHRNTQLLFKRQNYWLMLIGCIAISGGFVIMAVDKTPCGFSFWSLTISPILIVSGFIIEFFAILYTPQN